jgi:FecR protein
MKRREFIKLLSSAAATLTGTWQAIWPVTAHAQYQAPTNPMPASQAPPNKGPAAAPADNSVGQVATLQGSATVIRGNAATPLKIADPIYEKDTLQTALNSALGVTFDDETTFSLSANTRIVVNAFVYQQGGSGNAATFNVATGTAAFVASLVAKTGDMKITTTAATLGIRGTTGVVEVPETGGAAAPTIKLYPDEDGHVGQIDVFDRQGGRLGALTQGASAFALRLGPGGRIFAAPYQIPPQEAARDRGVLQRLNVSHTIGRQMTIQRRQLRGPNRQGPNNQRRPGGPQNFRPGGPQNPRPGGPRPFNRPPGGNGRRPPPKNSNDNRR